MAKEVSLARLIGPRNSVPNLTGTSGEEVISELLQHLGKAQGFTADAIGHIKESILAREREATTGIGNGIAIPHMKQCPYVTQACGIFGRAATGIEFRANDGGLVHLFFLLLTPPGGESDHVQLMKKIVRICRDRKTMKYLIRSEDLHNLAAILEEVDESPQ
ncbi:MAG: PTS sugar transporter subunit IIA [Planctomycetes bacterium]|nr:PTS sugar transporter subunit IIA [Planctomycetota bacterium]